MEVGIPRGSTMGPERIFPNPNEDLGEQRAPEGLQENMGDWSGEEPEEEEQQHEEEEDEEDDNENQGGYFYQPLNQDPEHGTWGHHSHLEHGAGEDASHPEPAEEEPGTNIQERLQEMGLHLPDPPADSDDEDGVEASATNSQTSIPMDAEHVELVKRTMAGINLPSLGVPPWARQISDEQWKDMVELTLQSRANVAGPKMGWE